MTADSLNSNQTLNQLFAWRVQQTPREEAYREFDADSDRWRSYTWEEVAALVDKWRLAIGSLQLGHGARVAILLPNGVTAVCVDQACLALGLVPVPMHALDNPASIGYILNDCEVSLLVLAGQEQWSAIAAACEAMPPLKRVVVADNNVKAGAGELGSIPIMTMREWLASARNENTGNSPTRHEITAADLAAIVYTSGTMGKPKGVMLTHRNVLSNIQALLAHVHPEPSDVFLSFLPLSHTFERTVGYYLPIAAGSCVAYARSVSTLADDFKIVRPTILVSVPRIYERFYAKLQEQLSRSNVAVRALFGLTQAVGWHRFCQRQQLPHPTTTATLSAAWLWPILRQLVARPVLAQFGGRLRVAVSGGAPMSQAVAQCFLAMGLPVLQGYGMTETSPVVAANSLDDNWPATVGRAMNGVQVRIGENNELQVRGPSVMKGYWNRPEDTRRAMTDDGWLRTGDQAVIDEGRIRISGRIKEIMVTSTGEKIAPADLELAIMADPLFEQVMVIGENRPFIAAFVVLNRTLWKKLCSDLDIDPNSSASLDSEAAREIAFNRIKQATRQFPHYAVPRAVVMTLEPWTVQNGLITPTLKLKRNPLHARFKTEIEKVYSSRLSTVKEKIV